MQASSDSGNVGAIILAAGASSRMGQPKQSLTFERESLLKRIAGAALNAVCVPVIAVTGANAEVSRRELTGLGVFEVFNSEWATGMGSSIVAGVRRLREVAPDTHAAVLLLCDQPFVTAEVISRLVMSHRTTGQPIVASQYGGTFGAPVLFADSIFPDLLQLDGAEGAKQVIKKHASWTALVPFPQGEMDLDTPADYELLTGCLPPML